MGSIDKDMLCYIYAIFISVNIYIFKIKLIEGLKRY